MSTRILIVISLIALLSGCAPKEKLVSVSSHLVDSINKSEWMYADATSIRQNSDKSIINYNVVTEDAYIRAAKQQFIDKHGFDGLVEIVAWHGTMEFDCRSNTYTELLAKVRFASGETVGMKPQSGRVLPNTPMENLMKYACMSTVKRTFLDMWFGSLSPL